MKPYILSLLAVFAGLTHAEDVTLVAENGSGNVGFSQTITLNQGDTAKLVFAAAGQNLSIVLNLASKDFDLPCYLSSATGIGELNPIIIAGPATLVLKSGSAGGGVPASTGLATLNITRSGITSPPAAIPLEAGTTWNVILESSSDLVNWTPANPGEYSGTEPKRFFRTRMVKKP